MADTFNKFAVAGRIRDDQVLLLGLPVQPAPNDPQRGYCVRPLSPDEALNLAAWLVAVSCRPRAEFLELLDAVERT
jgi:hypothetical protein